MAKDILFTDEQTKFLEEKFPSISQFEKLQTKLKESFDSNIKTLGSRVESIETTVDVQTKAINILESDVRSIGGKGLPKEKQPTTIAEENKKKFAFTLLDLG